MFRFNYHEPESLEDVVATLQEYGDDAAMLAGGTALLIDMRHGELSPEHIISLWGVPELAGSSWGMIPGLQAETLKGTPSFSVE